MTQVIELLPGDDPNRNNIKRQMHFTIFDIEEREAYTAKELSLLGIEINQKEYGKKRTIKPMYSTAQEHGDFGDLPFWREEVWKGEHLSAQGK